MKILRQSPSRKKVTLIVAATVVALLLVGTAAAYYYHVGPFHVDKSPTINLKPLTSEQKKAGEIQKKAIVIPDRNAKQNLPGTTPADTSTGSDVVTDITAFQDGDAVRVRNLIKTVASDGTCTLTLTNGNTTATKTSGIQALPSSSTCKGFDVPTSELSPGDWNITIAVTINGSTGSASKTLTVK